MELIDESTQLLRGQGQQMFLLRYFHLRRNLMLNLKPKEYTTQNQKCRQLLIKDFNSVYVLVSTIFHGQLKYLVISKETIMFKFFLISVTRENFFTGNHMKLI